MTNPDPTADLRKTAYLLLAAATLGVATAKIVGAENVFEPSRYRPLPGSFGEGRDPAIVPERVWPKTRPEPTPMFSSNDRSRWATIRALVDDGTYVVGKRENHTRPTGYADAGIIFEPDYQSLDKVMNPATGEFYSSKPPLMPTLLAAEYWVLKKVFGWSIVSDRWNVMCTIILTVNVLPFAAYLLLLARLIETHGRTDFGKLLAFTTACFGTYLVTFAGTLNNHTPAAFCVVFAIYPLMQSPLGVASRLTSGFFAGLAMALELPAAALVAGLFVPMLLVKPRHAVLFAVGAAVPIAALIACNFAAMGTWKPAYGEFGGPWYNYPGSHWAKLGTPAAKGIDFADESKLVYAFHLLLGHHGWFSLTPVWFLGAIGLWKLTRESKLDVNAVLGRGTCAGPLWTPRLLGAMTLAVSAVVFAFYAWKTNNYGGSTSGPRWLFWLTPLWIFGVMRAGDSLGKRGRLLAAVLLGFSTMSAFYPAWNPWRSPWILQWFELQGWVRY